MQFAVISDTHFGDENCTLVNHNTLKKGDKFDEFYDIVGQGNDYLILLGDIFDFSITDYATSYEVAKIFFKLVQKNNIAKAIIYVPGNHDFDIWHTVQHQINIIHQLKKGGFVRKFSWSAPGIIDDRTESNTPGFSLPLNIDFAINPSEFKGEPLFLNNITLKKDGKGKPLSFYLAYPNLYFVNDNEAILFTHGQYLEAFWSLAGEWIRKIAGRDLDLGKSFDMEELVALNVPLCQLACSGLGQAGPLTDLVFQVQQEAKKGDLKRIKKYLNNLDNDLDELTTSHWYDPTSWGKELLTDYLSNKAKKDIIKAIKNMKSTRYDEEFINDYSVQARFKDFYNASCNEIDLLNEEFKNFSFPRPETVIFGHTHDPIAWKAPQHPSIKVRKRVVNLYNTGGWLWKSGTNEFCGAEIFTYRDGKMESVRVAD